VHYGAVARLRRGRSPAVALATLFALADGAPAQTPDSRSEGAAVQVQTRHLGVALDTSTGAMQIQVPDASHDSLLTVPVPGLYLDGAPQGGFEPSSSGSEPLRLRNDLVTLHIDALGERAIALTWTARDSADHELELRIRSDDRTAYYGTGERFNGLDQRGYILPLISDDRYGNKGVGVHKPVPFFMSTQGFGVWVDGYAPGTFDLSGSERLVTRLRFRDSRFRVVFFGGPGLGDILEAFTALTGRPRVPPPWSLALWKSRDVHHNQDSVIADVERLRDYGIPASVLVIDSPWETGYNTFEVNTRQFRNPDRMFSRIRELGFELCLWLTPFINSHNVIDMPGIQPISSNFDEAARAGHLVEDTSGAVALSEWWKGEGGLVDFTDPEAVAWWHQQLRRTRAYGARAFKADDGEGNFVPTAVFHDGTSARAMKNRYAVLYDSVVRAYVDDELEGDGVIITRAGYTGAGRGTFAWAGDNRASFDFDDGLPSVIRAGQNAALSGIVLWGSDIAGYAGQPTAELFVRWTQFATFTPFMQVHMASNQGPWDFDDRTLDIFRRFARLRLQLFPYLYQALHEAARSGMPVIRPMALAFPADREAHEHIYQFLFGPDLLVAPIYRPDSHRSVYVPRGRWIDFWTGVALEGSQTVEVEAPLERIPLFVRAGAILPLLPEDVETLVPRHEDMDESVVALDERRVLQIWPGEAGALETWEGLSAVLTTGAGTKRLRVTSARTRPLEIELRHRRAAGLAVDGARGAQRLQELADVSERQDPSGWRSVVRFPQFEGTLTLVWTEAATPGEGPSR
jgi:alpha-D-xyloside xylohydrolase